MNIIRYILLACICPSMCFAQQQSDTIKVYFDLARPSLNIAAMTQLDSMAYFDLLPVNKKYGIIGYADYLGSEESNVVLSQDRANAISEYLQGLGVKPEFIETVIGNGEINRELTNEDGYPTDRRVDIIVGGFKETSKSATVASKKKADTMDFSWQVFFEEQTFKQYSGIKPKPGQSEVIEQLCKHLKENGSIKILISGHAAGKNESVLTSLERAEYVKWRLEQCGIGPNRVRYVGVGLTTKIEKGNNFSYSRRVDIKIDDGKHVLIPATKPPVVAKKIDITKIAKNETIRIDNIFFLPGSHQIIKESTEALFNLYTTMKFNPSLRINIEGHICCLNNTTGDGYDYDTKEYSLSKNRAKAVYEYLISKGIDKDRMRYEGFGLQNPMRWPERSKADENMNRRVEIRIIEK